MASNPIKIAELDFDQILTNLVDFMKTDPAFADYDFSGSGLRLLARVLAYVTFYQNYYLTAAVNEAFLDTAQLRASVASHARMLGYDIHGTQSARISANVAIEVSGSSAATLVLPKRTAFVLDANSAHVFYNLDDVELSQNTSTDFYEASGVELVEGRPLSYRFVVDENDPTQRFVIPNANIDYSTIEVRVQESAESDTVTSYASANSYLTIEPTDPVFFVQEAYDGFPEVRFGNGVVGLPVSHNNIVIVDYLISNGEEGNNIRGPFSIPSANIDGFVQGATVADANTVPSMGGTNTEDMDDARFLAPLVYQAQNRCVTVEDYKTIILANFGSQIAAINVFGGEQGDPDDPENRPVYGRVFIALKPKIGLRFTDSMRERITNEVLKPRSIIGVVPEIIDPDYTYLNINTSVKYDPKSTVRTKPALQSAIQDEILTYVQNNVEKFDTSFRFSRFVRVIDDADEAIVSSVSRIDLEKRIFPRLEESNQFVLKFNTPLRQNADGSRILENTSHRFTYENRSGTQQENCFLYEEDGAVHVAYRNSTGVITIFESNIGTLDAETGLITIDNFIPLAIEDNEIDVRVRVVPAVNDFTPYLNQLFTIDPESGVNIQLLNVTTATSAEQTQFFGGLLP